MSTLNALSLNNTRRSENQIVVFNRVPKVGSQTFMELLRRLALRNNFKFHRDSVQRVETIRLAPYQQEELAEMVSELPTPSGNEQIEYLMLLSLCENGELLSVTGVIKQVSTSTMYVSFAEAFRNHFTSLFVAQSAHECLMKATQMQTLDVA